MTPPRDVTSRLRQSVWNGSIPLEIRLHKGDCITYDESEPYLVQFPRLSYLGLLIPKLHSFFSRNLIYPDVDPFEAWLSCDNVPLKWHYPLGLLYDLYSGTEPHPGEGRKEDAEQPGLPWRLRVHFSDYPTEQLIKLDAAGKHLHDLYINGVKEADYLRNGTGKTIMSLNKDDSTQLWESVKQHNFSLFNPINHKLLNPQGVNLRHMPIKLYLPHASTENQKEEPTPGSVRVMQALVPPVLSSRSPQTVGTALNTMVPTLFPSRRIPTVAQPVLHGAVLPLTVNVEDLLRTSTYSDGWLHITVSMMS
ncbi:autophagy protein-like protein 5 [Sporormia fimetaria CBS 119925]|uniref:Autophagy protein 5 n=1 Tax=Sporormia fimetaria CBS 119925 TaxID=1340428 RepID=A0A6A6VJG1_9PLEO|nr:autophagy protein-like protein 5 [Sporormia fimetaria CBS 119925]